MDSPFNTGGMHAITTVWVTKNNEIYRAMERTICTVPLHDRENRDFFFYHVIVNSQLNRDNLRRCYIISNEKTMVKARTMPLCLKNGPIWTRSYPFTHFHFFFWYFPVIIRIMTRSLFSLNYIYFKVRHFTSKLSCSSNIYQSTVIAGMS